MNLLLSWLVQSLAVWAASQIVPGVSVPSFSAAIIVAAILGLINFLLGALIFNVLAIGTLGLGYLLAFVTRWVTSAILLKIVAAMTDKLQLSGFSAAMIAALVIAIIGAAGDRLLNL